MELVADTHSFVPYFAIQLVTWYQGGGIKSMPWVFSAFVKKAFKFVWAPFMFSSLLATFRGTGGMFGDRSMIRVQMLGA